MLSSLAKFHGDAGDILGLSFLSCWCGKVSSPLAHKLKS